MFRLYYYVPYLVWYNADNISSQHRNPFSPYAVSSGLLDVHKCSNSYYSANRYIVTILIYQGVIVAGTMKTEEYDNIPLLAKWAKIE